MAPPSIVAGLVTTANGGQRRELATSAGAKLVNGTGHPMADLTPQGHAARRLGRRATHAGNDGRDPLRQAGRNPPPREIIGLTTQEGNPEGGAAGAASLAVVGHGARIYRKNSLF